MPPSGRFTTTAGRPTTRNRSASACRAAVLPPNPGTSTTGPSCCGSAFGGTAYSRLTDTATDAASASTTAVDDQHEQPTPGGEATERGAVGPAGHRSSVPAAASGRR